MRIAIVGLGHLGSVTAGCLTKLGHEVIGVDRSRDKVAATNKGRSPVDELGLQRLIRAAWRDGRISAFNRISHRMLDSDMILVCVDTPRTVTRSLTIKSVVQVCERIRELGQASKAVPLVVIRSTLPPGAFDSSLARLCLPPSKLRLAYNPDFCREGSAVADFMTPERIVIGVRFRRDAWKLRQLYKSIKAPVFVTTWSNAEILKCADNAFHALKVTFANEIGRICQSFGADGDKVMSLLCSDTRLNISSAYLRPGLPFGGPCLNKDVDALVSGAKRQALDTPLLRAILQSNQLHFKLIVRTIKRKGYNVGFLGLSHKAGVRDYRVSHLLGLAKRLHAQGVEVRVFDPKLGEERASSGSGRLPSLRQERSSKEILRRSDIVFASRQIRPLSP
jgi:GDP-mannose 6-dehydrogenase